MTPEEALTPEKIDGCMDGLGEWLSKNNVNPWTACAALHIILAKLEAQGVVLHCETELTPINECSDDLH